MFDCGCVAAWEMGQSVIAVDQKITTFSGIAQRAILAIPCGPVIPHLRWITAHWDRGSGRVDGLAQLLATEVLLEQLAPARLGAMGR